MNEAEVLNSIPMRVMAFHKESQGKTRYVWILHLHLLVLSFSHARLHPSEHPIVASFLGTDNARTFGEVYVALVKMKMNLLALGIFEDVELTMEPCRLFAPLFS